LNIAGTAGAGAANVNVALNDGTGRQMWLTNINAAATQTVNVPNNLSGLNLKFVNGVNIVISLSSGFSAGNVVANMYYTVP
jgi:hypothetical protein